MNIVQQNPLRTTSNPGQEQITSLIQAAGKILLGKEHQIRLAVSGLLANGHLLINDIPGVGKTTLANLLARLFGLDFRRIQFTSDMLPADITGVSIFNQKEEKFVFHPGPIFGQLILADEINRASPKTQSALLEAMEEKQVSVEGKTWPLPKPFFVVATQNPQEHAGTFPLPESQLDRFMLSLDIGYPDRFYERQMLQSSDPREQLSRLTPVISSASLVELQHQVTQVHVSEPLLDYLQAIVNFSRTGSTLTSGYSPRAAMTLLAAARAWAYIDGRHAVIPEDLQTIIPATLHHLRKNTARADAHEDLLKHVPIP